MYEARDRDLFVDLTVYNNERKSASLIRSFAVYLYSGHHKLGVRVASTPAPILRVLYLRARSLVAVEPFLLLFNFHRPLAPPGRAPTDAGRIL